MSLLLEQQAEFVSDAWEIISNSSGMDTASFKNGSTSINGSTPNPDIRLLQVIDKPVKMLSKMIEGEEDKEDKNGQKPMPILFMQIGKTGLVAVSKNFPTKPETPKLKIISALVAEKGSVEIGRRDESVYNPLAITRSTIENATGVRDETIGDDPHIVIGFKLQLTAIYNASGRPTEIAAASGNILTESQRENAQVN